MDLSKFAGLTSDNKNLSVKFQPLNFENLLKSGAFRVTHIGLDDKYNPDPKAGFSIVSAYNDAVGKQTQGWPNNPYAYNIVKDMFEKNPENITAHKYLQIIESARQLGLKDSDIYLNNKKEELVNPFYKDPFEFK